jgi:hypothetical protein
MSVNMLQYRRQVQDYLRTSAPAAWRRMEGDDDAWSRLIGKLGMAGTREGWADSTAIRALACALKRDIVVLNGYPDETRRAVVFYRDATWLLASKNFLYDICNPQGADGSSIQTLSSWLNGASEISVG